MDETTTLLDIVGFVEKIEDLSKAQILDAGNGRKFIYEPKTGRGFQEIPNWAQERPAEVRSVSSVKSLAAAALEELSREENQCGEGMTVIFDNKGATLFINDLDTEKKHLRWRYNRCSSQQWDWLCAHENRVLEHKDFVRVIQGLKPSIENYQELFRAIRRANITDKVDMTSNPIIEDGQLGSSIAFNLKVENGETKASIPTEIPLSMSYSRCSEAVYDFTVYVDVERIKKDQHHTAGFRLNFIERFIIEDQEVQDEITLFESMTAERPKILKLLNFS